MVNGAERLSETCRNSIRIPSDFRAPESRLAARWVWMQRRAGPLSEPYKTVGRDHSASGISQDSRMKHDSWLAHSSASAGWRGGVVKSYKPSFFHQTSDLKSSGIIESSSNIFEFPYASNLASHSEAKDDGLFVPQKGQ